MTDQEDVPRFSLRRGARFLETFRDEAETEDADENWMAGLGSESEPDAAAAAAARTESEPPPAMSDSGPPVTTETEPQAGAGLLTQADEVVAVGDERAAPVADPPAGGPLRPPRRTTFAQVPGLVDAMATLTERLSTLEEALARALAACTGTKVAHGHGQSLDEASAPTGPNPSRTTAVEARSAPTDRERGGGRIA